MEITLDVIVTDYWLFISIENDFNDLTKPRKFIPKDTLTKFVSRVSY